MASSESKFDQITTESQENLEIKMEEDGRDISSSEYSTTDYSSDSSESPQAKRAAINAKQKGTTIKQPLKMAFLMALCWYQQRKTPELL